MLLFGQLTIVFVLGIHISYSLCYLHHTSLKSPIKLRPTPRRLQKTKLSMFWKTHAPIAPIKPQVPIREDFVTRTLDIIQDQAEYMANNVQPIVFVLLTIGVGYYTWRASVNEEKQIEQDIVKEIHRANEYQENMYFEAVEGILERLNASDIDTRPKRKQRLLQELEEVDPKHLIRDYLDKKTPRPYLKDIRNATGMFTDGYDESIDFNVLPEDQISYSNDNDSSNNEEGSEGEDENEDNEGIEEPNTQVEQPSKAMITPPVFDQTSISNPLDIGKLARIKDGYLEVLGEVYDKLKNMHTSDKNKLIQNLKSNMERISDPTKREAALRKIAARIGDDKYWNGYLADISPK